MRARTETETEEEENEDEEGVRGGQECEGCYFCVEKLC